MKKLLIVLVLTVLLLVGCSTKADNPFEVRDDEVFVNVSPSNTIPSNIQHGSFNNFTDNVKQHFRLSYFAFVYYGNELVNDEMIPIYTITVQSVYMIRYRDIKNMKVELP